jgi:hypothetical protein
VLAADASDDVGRECRPAPGTLLKDGVPDGGNAVEFVTDE